MAEAVLHAETRFCRQRAWIPAPRACSDWAGRFILLCTTGGFVV